MKPAVALLLLLFTLLTLSACRAETLTNAQWAALARALAAPPASSPETLR